MSGLLRNLLILIVVGSVTVIGAAVLVLGFWGASTGLAAALPTAAGDTSPEVAPEVQGVSNSAVTDDFRISLIKTAEGDEATRDFMDSQRIEYVLSADSVPGQREGWRLFEAQFAIENLQPFAREAPQLCALLTDSGGYSRIEPVKGSCPSGWCGPRYDVPGIGHIDRSQGLVAASGVRYNGLRVFMELPVTMSPSTLMLYTPANRGDCASQDMQTSWGLYDFSLAPSTVVLPFDAPPDGIPSVWDGESAIHYGDVSIAIDNIRVEPNQFAPDSYVLNADATYTNDGGMDIDTNQYPVHALTVHESGKNVGKFDVVSGMVPPGVPKTFTVPFGYVDKAHYAGSWVYVVFVDGGGNAIGQARAQIPE